MAQKFPFASGKLLADKPHMNRRDIKRLVTVFALAAVAVGSALSRNRTAAPERGSELATVTRVVDGDTLLLDNEKRIRLIGVDTPETKDPRKPVEYFGKEASAFTKTFIEHKKVRLEFDQSQQDKYGRTLAYVIRAEDNACLNLEIIRQGYGHALTKYPFQRMEEFRAAEREARENRRGLWK